MYKTPVNSALDEKTDDKVLMGASTPTVQAQSSIQKVSDAGGSLLATDRAVGGDLRSKMREDPLMVIKQREAQHMRSLTAEQLQMHRMREEALELEYRESLKREEKSSHRHRHHKRDSKENRRRDANESEDVEERRRRKEKKKRKREEEKESRRRTEHEDVEGLKVSREGLKVSGEGEKVRSHRDGEASGNRDEDDRRSRAGFGERNADFDERHDMSSGSRRAGEERRSEERLSFDDDDLERAGRPSSSSSSSSSSTKQFKRSENDLPGDGRSVDRYGADRRRRDAFTDDHRRRYDGGHDDDVDEDEGGDDGHVERRRKGYDDDRHDGDRRHHHSSSFHSSSHSSSSHSYRHGPLHSSFDRHGHRDTRHSFGDSRGDRQPYDRHPYDRHTSSSSHHQRHHRSQLELSDAERNAALAQMQRGAQQLHHARSTLVDNTRDARAREEAEHRNAAADKSRDDSLPSFLSSMHHDAIKTNSIEDIVSRSRFYLSKDE